MLDLEASNNDGPFLSRISESGSLRSLDVGATRITRKGLAAICEMQQVRSLDLWETDLVESDLDMLAALPNLEYLSVGHAFEGEHAFRVKTLLPRLRAISSLK